MKYSNPFDNEEIATYTVETFGKSVRQRREQLGISLREMARRVGISAVYLGDIERGNRPATSGDYMVTLEREMCLTDSQKLTYTLMAKVSHPNTMDLMDNYFINNPNSLKFLLKAIENNLNNAEWEKIYKLTFSQK